MFGTHKNARDFDQLGQGGVQGGVSAGQQDYAARFGQTQLCRQPHNVRALGCWLALDRPGAGEVNRPLVYLISRLADGASKYSFRDARAAPGLDRKDECGLLVVCRTTQRIHQRELHRCRQERLNRSSSTLTSGVRVRTNSTASATASGRSIFARGVKPGR